MEKMKGRLGRIFLTGVLFLLLVMPGHSLALQRGLYIADAGNEVVYYMDPEDNLYQFTPFVGQYLGSPIYLEQDLAGNLIVSVYFAGTVIETPPQGGSYEIIASGLDMPTGLAADTSGNIYVAEESTPDGNGQYHGRIWRISQTGPITLIASELGRLHDLEFDDMGNLYASVNESPGKILRISRESLSGQPPATVEVLYNVHPNEGGLSLPKGLTFRNGYLYVADTNTSRVVQIDPVTRAASVYYSGIVAGTWGGPFGIAFDEVGNLYFSAIDVLGMIDTNKVLTVLSVVPANGHAGPNRFGYAWGLLYAKENLGPITSNVSAIPNPAPVNTSILLTATLEDSYRVASAEYSLDGGTDWYSMSAQDGAFDGPTEHVAWTIGAFSDAGVYEVCVRGTDAAGNPGDKACTFLVVYDPNDGFVTGRGWITSPPGAYTLNPLFTGKADFAFESKYKKGANVPTGDTKFHFKIEKKYLDNYGDKRNKRDDFHFESESYQWLVVAGPKAQYKGSGTIKNMDGDYGFMLTATDGQINGGGGVDKFRIKIWDTATGNIIYDNKMGALDTEDPITALGGGEIKIHKK